MKSNAVEQIKERLSIEELVSSYMKLEHAGANYKGRCPFHNEKTPSFMVSPDRGSYYCFGCGVKGDIFTFVQEFEKVDFKGALKILANRAGVVLDEYRPSADAKQEEDEKDKLSKIMESATSYFEEALENDDKALDYLKNRGLEAKTIKEWQLGSTKKGWSNLYEYLKGKGFADVDIEKAGLAKKSEKTNYNNSGMYDRFRDRIIFPISDNAGKIIAFTGRFKDWSVENRVDGAKNKDIVEDDHQRSHTQAKYLNSPDTPLFDKSRTLYGFHKAKLHISKWKFSLLVEGQMDLLMCHQTGFNNAVATSGTALTIHQLKTLSRFSKNLMIAYDGDKAGVDAARRAYSLALSIGMDVKIASMPKDMDPADIIKNNPEDFKKAIKKGIHVIEFYLLALIARGLPGRSLGKEIESEILPYVKSIESPIDQAHFVSLISSRTGIQEEVLIQALKKTNLQEPVVRDTIHPQQNIPQYINKNRLIAGTYLLLNEEEKAKAYIHNSDEIKDELLFTVEEWLQKSGQSPEIYLSDLLKSVEKEKLHEELKEAMKEYLIADQSGDELTAKEKLKRSEEIRKELSKF